MGVYKGGRAKRIRGAVRTVVRVCRVVTIFLVVVSCGTKEEVGPRDVVRPVKMVTVASGDNTLGRRYPGRVRAFQRVELAFQIPGTLIELPVDEGQQVKRDQIIARLDPRDFEIELRSAEGQLAKGLAALERAELDYDRIRRIKNEDPGAVSQSMVDQRREAVDRANADIQSLKAAVDAAKDRVGYTTLRAPFDGVIARKLVDNFAEVQAKQSIVNLQDISRVEIVVDVPENVIAQVKREGSTSTFAEFAAAPGKQYALTLKEFSTEADPRTQTYQVVLIMPAPDEINVLPGMTANVFGKTEVSTDKQRVFIPAAAVFADPGDQAHVWVVDPQSSTIQKRRVVTGRLSGADSIEIMDGLRAGDTIAVSGVSRLREGMKVRPMDQQG